MGFSAMLAEEYILIFVLLSAAVRAEGTQNTSTAESPNVSGKPTRDLTTLKDIL